MKTCVKFLIGLIVLIGAGSTFHVLSTTVPKTVASKPEYRNPAAPAFPVLAFGMVGRPEFWNKTNIRNLSDAGFNLVVSDWSTLAKFKDALNLCEGTSLKLMIPTGGLRLNILTSYKIKELVGNPHIAGIFVDDEPNASAFPRVAAYSKAIQSEVPGIFEYCNLFPNYATSKVLGAFSYKDYLEEYIKEVNPAYISFDNYPFIKTKDGVEMRKDYFLNFETVRNVCSRYDLPMWSFACCAGHLGYASPTLGNISLQIFTGIAYGAQGIQYYGIYGDTIAGTPSVLPVFRTGGKITPTYKAVRRLNAILQAWRPFLLGNTVKGVWHTGAEIPLGTTRLKNSNLPNWINDISSDGIGLAISYFENKGREYILILNRDAYHSQNVQLNLSKKVSYINKVGNTKPLEKTTISLSPGDCIILQ